MRDGFEQYRAELDAVKLTENEKAALVQTLTEREPRGNVTRFRKVKWVALAAAVMLLGALAMVAAGYLTDFRTGYDTVAKLELTENGKLYYSANREFVNPIEVDEDGAVWFIGDGQRINITGQFDDETPFIYRGKAEVTGKPWYIAIGGSVYRYLYTGELQVDYGTVDFHPGFGGMIDENMAGYSGWSTANGSRWWWNAREQIFAELAAEGYDVPTMEQVAEWDRLG